MHSPFVCAWHNPDGPPCPRPAADESGYCFWHRATHRLTALWQPKPVIEGTHPPWAETLVEISVYVFSLSFLHRAFHHSLWLHSGVAPDNNVSVNPMYALLLLGMGLGFLGKVLSLTRRNVPAAWFVRTRHFCYTGLWALGLALLATVERGTWQEKAGLMLVLMPVLLMLHRLERQSSLASVGATVVGLGCIVAAGLSMYVFEVVYQLTGELDYLSTEVPQHFLTRYIAASWFLFIGLGYVAAALDAGVSLLWTGGRPMIDAFRRSGGGAFRTLFWAVAMAFIFYGQAHLLRFLPWTILGGFVLDVGPWVFGLPYLVLVLGLHVWWTLRARPKAIVPAP